ncbi:helix-turn-helix domain-containing protein [Arthrobacter sp. MMS18-M83]|uniref:helix-turn-helix domain-containing protein n=1 Tax=Arthrobacter sp. MMS18-M83 TaxID=2996261 RepID=UPI00227B8507|nr:helix-turn-helix domain-containing protein [Arthrobacter sp. MMS18-M83]WAH97527.1 helix-turn-helix domain-containing protein [Arthrobacter sp. MMS18-M83]
MEKPSSLGEFIRERRLALGWEQHELAGKLSVSQQTLSRWENGSAVPRNAKLPSIAAALEVSIAELEALQTRIPREVIQEVAPLRATLPFNQLNETQFEQFTVALLQEKFPESEVYRNGDRGHKQQGIDVFVKHPDGKLDGVQCKKVAQFGRANVLKAIKEFDPTVDVAAPQIYLSRTVSPGARKAADDTPPWTIKGSEELSNEVIALDPDRQLHLVRRFFPAYREAFLGAPNPSPWLSPDIFRLPLDRADGFFRQSWNLVGRQEELERIEAAFGLGGNVVVVEAPAGRGKTRLMLALADHHEEEVGHFVRFLLADGEVRPDDLSFLPSGPLTLIIDDAHMRDDLGRIVREVLAVQSKARIVLAIRSNFRQEVGDQLRVIGKSLRPGENLFTLKDLSFQQSRQLAIQVASPQVNNPQVLDALAELGVDSPFFVVVGGELLKQGRIKTPTLESSPEFRREILIAFRTVLAGDDETRMEVLRAVAAMQPFRSDWPEFQESLATLVDKKYRLLAPVLRNLEDIGLLLRRGASYRVVPDLLGDIVLSQALINEDTGTPTSYASELVTALSDEALKHALVNVGRVDAQIQMSGFTRTAVVESLWGPFQSEFKAADAGRRFELANLLKELAYYQPDRSLEIAQWLLDHPVIGPFRKEELRLVFPVPPVDNRRAERILIDVLERVAYHERLVVKAMELLRRLIAGPLGQVGKPDDPAAAALRKLMNFRYPLEFVQTALLEVLRWLANAEMADAERLVLMEVIRPILATEGMEDRSDGAAIYLSPTLVRAEVVRPLRRLVIAHVLHELSRPHRGLVIQQAARLLTDALRHPIGLLGLPVTDDDRRQWEPDHLELLAALRDRLAIGVSRAEAGAFREAVHWHAKYGHGPVQAKAREVWMSLPTDLHSKIAEALLNRSPVLDSADIEDEMQQSHAWQQEVARELLGSCDDQETLDVVEEQLRNNSELGWSGEPHQFAEILFHSRPELASRLLDRISAHYDPVISPLTVLAMTVEFEKEPQRAAARMDGILRGTDAEYRRHAARALAWSAGQGLDKVPGGRTRLRQLLGDEDDLVVRQGLWAIRLVAQTDPSAAFGLVDAVDITRSNDCLGEFVSLFGPYGPLNWADLNLEMSTRVLHALVNLPVIDDFQIQQLLKDAAKPDPRPVLELLEQRVEREITLKSHNYRALPVDEFPRSICPAARPRPPYLSRYGSG